MGVPARSHGTETSCPGAVDSFHDGVAISSAARGRQPAAQGDHETSQGTHRTVPRGRLRVRATEVNSNGMVLRNRRSLNGNGEYKRKRTQLRRIAHSMERTDSNHE